MPCCSCTHPPPTPQPLITTSKLVHIRAAVCKAGSLPLPTFAPAHTPTPPTHEWRPYVCMLELSKRVMLQRVLRCLLRFRSSPSPPCHVRHTYALLASAGLCLQHIRGGPGVLAARHCARRLDLQVRMRGACMRAVFRRLSLACVRAGTRAHATSDAHTYWP